MIRIFTNPVLIPALVAWALAQAIKIPLEYFNTREWNWALLFRAGGMPSSHSALMVATTHSIGLHAGFDSPLYALSFAISMIVIYDATGIRRQAGKHAEIINRMIRDLTTGHPLREEELREVLGHTPLEVLGGVIFGLAIAEIFWLAWR